MKFSSGIFLGALLLAAPAIAQDDVDDKARGAAQDADQAVDVHPEAKADYEEMTSGEMGWRPESYDISGGLGAGGFAQDLGEITGTGFGWTARAGVDFNQLVGAELGYQGFNSDVSAIIAGQGTFLNDENLQGNLFTANARLGVPLDVSGHELKPYATAGVGYGRIGANETLQAVGFDDDNVFAIPLGIGLGYELNETFMVDGRLTYSILTGVSQPLVGDDADAWTGLVNIGAKFGR